MMLDSNNINRLVYLFAVSFVLFFILPPWAKAQGTFVAASCSQSDVNAIINGPKHTAADGDIIQVPAGTCTWTSGVSTSKAISIIGPGASSLTINENIPAASGCTPLFQFTPTVVGSLTRLSGFTMQPLSGVANSCLAVTALGKCTSSGCPNIRIDHNTFSGWAGISHLPGFGGYAPVAIGDLFGVIDHNSLNGKAGTYLQFANVSHASYLGQGQYGDYSWNQPENYGSANFIFFEDNTFNTAGCCEMEVSAGGYANMGGARVVARHNTYNSMDNINFALSWHGTESEGRPRSGRAFEFYENIWNCTTSCIQTLGARGGTGLTWGNTMTWPNILQNFFTMSTMRAEGNPGGWPSCDGSAPYDTNDGVTYYSGTIASVSTTTIGLQTFSQITVSGTPGWTTNQWSPAGAPYSVHDVTQSKGSEIVASGSNTFTIFGAYAGAQGNWTPAVNDSIQILRATVCLDQAGGRGAGSLYTGTGVNLLPLLPVQASAQVPSPTYFWMNAFNGASLTNASNASGVHSFSGRVIRNRDFYTENTNQAAQTSSTSPFDGTTSTTGIGHGTLADRPTSCTPSSNGGSVGTAYWETDHNQLDFCIAANTWSATGTSPSSYVPYSYPHPLISGGSVGNNAPNPPTGLSALVQ